jgi:homoserine kinase type II
MKVYVVQHVHVQGNDEEDVKFLGVYSSRENADAAITRLGQATGFAETSERFFVDEYQVDKDHWVEGFVTVESAPTTDRKNILAIEKPPQYTPGGVPIRKPPPAPLWLWFQLIILILICGIGFFHNLITGFHFFG